MATEQEAVKILEISGKAWRAGLSQSSYGQNGGLYRVASNFDPFEIINVFMPGLTPTQRGAGTITDVPTFVTPVVESGTSYLYVHTPTKLYKVSILTGTATDITVSSGITTGSIKGAIFYQGYYIYATNDKVIANTVGTATNTDLVTGLATNAHIFCVGADLNLYFTHGNKVGRVTNYTGTTGNSSNVFDAGTGIVLKDLLNDGRYLVLIGDNSNSVSVGLFRCIVGFWNMSAGYYDQLWDNFEDNSLIGGEIMDGWIYIFGYNNFFKCASSASPTVVSTFAGGVFNGVRPNGPQSILKAKGSIYFGAAGSSQIYAYGNPIPGEAKIFFNPHAVTSGNVSCLAFDGISMWAGTESSTLFQFNTGSGRGSSSIYTSLIPFKQAYKFAFAKVILFTDFASDQSVGLRITSKNAAGVVTDLKNYSFNTDGKMSRMMFHRKAANTSSDVEDFDDIFWMELDTVGAGILRVEVWGVPLGVTATQK